LFLPLWVWSFKCVSLSRLVCSRDFAVWIAERRQQSLHLLGGGDCYGPEVEVLGEYGGGCDRYEKGLVVVVVMEVMRGCGGEVYG
jgi:hypothetical protein